MTTYYVRWKAGGQPQREPFRHSGQADSFRSKLLSAARDGEAFSITTGRPVSWERRASGMSWYAFACKYADMKWKDASAKYRQDIARALTSATPAMLTGKPRHDMAAMRRALKRWGFNPKQRASAPPDVAVILGWVAGNTADVSSLMESDNARRLLDTATTRLDGKRAAATTFRRHRMILGNAMDYARECRLTEGNPIRELKWTLPKVLGTIDRRCVVNPRQGRALLNAIRDQKPSGPRLVAFFAVMYFAALRPEEAINLAEDDVSLAADEDAWGDFTLRGAAPEAGGEWTDNGSYRDQRQLKHRAEGDSRTVPIVPELARILREHIGTFGTGPDGQLFTGTQGGDLPAITVRRAWVKARETALTPEEVKSPLARRPYDLRHACVSTWLNGGVPPTQVAEWAGHGVDVLLRIYAKCLVGQDDLAKRRVLEALRDDDT